MCPRTSWSLSSLTLNMVLGRASVTSPSISIFSSLPPIGAWEGSGRARRLLALELRVSRALLEEGLHGALEILRGEQLRELLRRDLVGAIHPALAVAADDALGGGVRLRRARGEAMGEAHALLVHLAVVDD